MDDRPESERSLRPLGAHNDLTHPGGPVATRPRKAGPRRRWFWLAVAALAAAAGALAWRLSG